MATAPSPGPKQPPTSPTSSLQAARPSLEQLVSHFLASKRSLQSTSHVWRANEIVASARVSLEDIASLNAKSVFVRASIDKQLHVLAAVRHGIDAVSKDGRADFKAVLRRLDAADVRVKNTLQLLKTTKVDPSLRPDDEVDKTLFDFVDEQGVDRLNEVFRQCIDRTTDAQEDLDRSTDAFGGELQSVQNVLASISISAEDRDFSPVASMFRALEIHATEMADLLQSLVRHYDLCLTALRHTEGGGEAVQQAEGDLPSELGVDMLQREAPPQPVTEAELTEMVQVLDNDAREVDDVVKEIRDHAAEMERQLEHISSQVQMLANERDSMSEATRLLGHLSKNLPEYIEAGQIYADRWSKEKTTIEEKMVELESIRDFYDRFLGAYEGLITEVSRRKMIESRMDKIVQEAMVKVQKLYEEDVEAREDFKQEQGEFLPSDIWPGLTSKPKEYEIRVVDGSNGNEDSESGKKETLESDL